jgi:enoyl-CoA hydratase
MPILSDRADNGVLEIVIDVPPVNALDLAHLSTLIELVEGVARRPEVSCVLLRAEGRGFVGGGDVKEVQRLDGYAGILGQTELSLAATLAIQQCAVPVIAAVHRYCIGLGVLLAGTCDAVVASTGTKFILAEVDNGATGGAIQAIGLMPEKRLRIAMFTCDPVTAEELHGYGTVHAVVDESELVATARDLADRIASKPTRIVRAAKSAIDGSLHRPIERLYRQELSYTYELNMRGDASAARDTFVRGDRGSYLAED